MKIWWESRCDANHVWETYDDESPGPPQTALICPVDGFAAVTISPQPPADRAVVTLRPAARIVDSVVKSVGHSDEYFVEISSFDGAEARTSLRAMPWDAAIAKAGLFRGTSWSDALVRWSRAGLDKA